VESVLLASGVRFECTDFCSTWGCGCFVITEDVLFPIRPLLCNDAVNT
jgi:hypothetical protein